MSYRALKQKRDEKERLLKWILLCIFVAFIGILTIIDCILPSEQWKYYFHQPSVSKRKEGELRIHFLDVGQGDSTLIELPDGKIMLIDGGNGSRNINMNILRYLNALDIEVIDYLVVTHADRDHCGGIEEIFACKEVLNAYMPLTFDANQVAYAEAYDAAVEEDCALIEPSRSVDLSVEDGYILRFLYPYAKEAEGLGSASVDENERSVVIWLDYGGTSALFCGDAPESVEEKLVWEDRLGLLSQRVTLSETEILKVGHHGSDTSSSKSFLEYLGVETAVVSCGKNNGYSHPHQEVLENLAEVGASVYRTDLQGHIMLTVSKEGTYTLQTVEK